MKKANLVTIFAEIIMTETDFTVLVRNFRDHVAVAGTAGIKACTLFDEMQVSSNVGIYILKKLFKRKEGWKIQGATHNLTEEEIDSILHVDKLQDITIVAPDNVIWNILGIDSITLRQKLPDMALVLLSIIACTKERGCLITHASKLMNSPKIHSVVEKLVLYGIISKRMLISNNARGVGSRVANRTNILHLIRYSAEYDPSVDNCFFESNDDAKQSIIDFIVQIMKSRKINDISASSLSRFIGIGRRKMHLIRSTMPTVKAPKIYFFEKELVQHGTKFRKVWYVGLNDTSDSVQLLPYGCAVIRHMSAIEQIVLRLNETKDGLSTRDFRTYLGMGKKRANDFFQEILQSFKYPTKKVSEGKVISFKLLPRNSLNNVENPNRNLTQLQEERINLALEILTRRNGIMPVKSFFEEMRSEEMSNTGKPKSTFDHKSLKRLIDYMLNNDMIVKSEHETVVVIALKEAEDLDTRIQYFIENLISNTVVDSEDSDDDNDVGVDGDDDADDDVDRKTKTKRNISRKPRPAKSRARLSNINSPRRKRPKRTVDSSSSDSDSDSDFNGETGAGDGDDDNIAEDNGDNDDDNDEVVEEEEEEEEGENKNKRKRVARTRNSAPRSRRDKFDQTENLSEFDHALILEAVVLDTVNRKLLHGEFIYRGVCMQMSNYSFKSNAVLLSNFLSLEPAILLVPQRVTVKQINKKQISASRNYVLSLMKRDNLFTIAGIVSFIVANLGHDLSPGFVDLLNVILKKDDQTSAAIRKPSYYAIRTRILQFYCSDEPDIDELTDKFNVQQLCEVFVELLKYNWIDEVDSAKKNYSLRNSSINRDYLSNTLSGLFGTIYGKVVNENTKIGDGKNRCIASYSTISENFEKKYKRLTGADALTLIHSAVSGLGIADGELRVQMNESTESIQLKTSPLVPSNLNQLVDEEQDIDVIRSENEPFDENSIQISYPNSGHYQKSLNRVTSSFQIRNEIEVPLTNTNTCTKWKTQAMPYNTISTEVRQHVLQLLLNFKDEALTVVEIQKNLGDVSLNEIQLAVKFWVANNFVIEVPCMINIDHPPSYVHKSYANLFVVSNNDEGFCPWMTLKGERNMAMFSMFRSKVLSTLTCHPGSNIQKLSGALPMLLMFQTKVLLQILEEDGLICTDIEKSTTLSGPFDMESSASTTGKFIYFVKLT